MQNEQDSRHSGRSAADPDWDKRVLCSDGNCIGVIGPDGRCKECGKPYEGALPETSGGEEAPAELSDGEDPPAATEEPEAGQADTNAPPGDDDWDKRVLCSDGNCIGVIGPDGRCKECGKPHTE